MKCPIDSSALLMMERQGIEIDYCPTCRGVWLDRGELDKLIERGSTDTAPRAQAPAPRMHENDSYSSHNSYQKKHKKEGLLGDLFDF